MSRASDIGLVRTWLQNGKVEDPAIANVIGRVCDHAENSTQALSRDWEAVRVQAAIQLCASMMTGQFGFIDVERALFNADVLVAELRKVKTP